MRSAEQHRPTDRDLLRREVLRLHAQGLRPRDIADAFGMNPSDVVSLIYSTGILAE
jgi:DNA-binding CsgD family transcriptional regulator